MDQLWYCPAERCNHVPLLSPSSYNLEMDRELQSTVQDFMAYFELVFDIDWDHTKSTLENSKHYIAEDGTFLHPGVEDEENNWANRARLLESYRALQTLLKERGVADQ